MNRGQKPQIFSRLSEIRPENPKTYNKIFLTIDIDWAIDEVINYTIDIIERADVEATWFITHQTDVINRLRRNPKFEIGIHPNFNFLLDCDPRNGKDARQVVDNLLKIVPNVKCLRAHSLVSSNRILQIMPEYGLTHESNLYMPPKSCDSLLPFRIWNDVVRVPHFFEDDLFLLSPEKSQVSISHHIVDYCENNNGLRVLDFHPIHVFLNTENIDRYEWTREFHLHSEELIKYRYAGEGIRAGLEALLRLR